MFLYFDTLALCFSSVWATAVCSHFIKPLQELFNLPWSSYPPPSLSWENPVLCLPRTSVLSAHFSDCVTCLSRGLLPPASRWAPWRQSAVFILVSRVHSPRGPSVSTLNKFRATGKQVSIPWSSSWCREEGMNPCWSSLGSFPWQFWPLQGQADGPSVPHILMAAYKGSVLWQNLNQDQVSL